MDEKRPARFAHARRARAVRVRTNINRSVNGSFGGLQAATEFMLFSKRLDYKASRLF